MSSLNQYRGIGRGQLAGTNVVGTSNPPNPFSNNQVANFIESLIPATLPDPNSDNQLLYCVVMPPGVNSTQGALLVNIPMRRPWESTCISHGL
jgi:hypothetical protein